MEKTSVGVIGTGAIGTFVGMLLQQAGFECCFVARAGIDVSVKQITWQNRTFSVVNQIDALQACHIVVVTVKATDLQFIDRWLDLLRPGAAVWILCNGYVASWMGKFERNYPHLKLRWGTVTFGVRQDSGNHVYLVAEGAGAIKVGPFAKNAKRGDRESEIFALIAACEWDERVRTSIQKKWLFNTALNSLCGLHQLPNNRKALALKRELRELFDEAYRLGQSLFGDWPEDGDRLFSMLTELIEQTGSNENSMARDIRLGRKTESEFMAGLALQFGPRFPQLCCAHKSLEKLIKVRKNSD